MNTRPVLTLCTVALLMAGCRGRAAAKTQDSALRTQHSVLRVCADPNNLPFSDLHEQGFENRIADLVAHDLGRKVAYTWWPQRRGFVRMTLKKGDCDVLVGVPTNFDLASTTAPYYRSSYVFVSRRDRHTGITSLDDRRLRKMRIGVQLAGDDGSPPLYALASRELIDNIRGYPVYGDYNQPEPTRAIIASVVRGDVDVAIMWGPQAGWYARHSAVPLDLTPVTPQIDPPFLPFVFDISMAVRRGDTALRDRLEQALDRHRDEIERILDAYGVPRV